MTKREHERESAVGEVREGVPDGAVGVTAVGKGTRLDVWSRSGPKYRVRAIVLLLINIVLFAGVGGFAFWLRSGVWFAPATEGYWDQITQAFRFAGGNNLTLAALLLRPISVQVVPMQIPILGLLMSALIAIPILVAILYRFWSALPFILVVGLLAVMPWLALTLLGSCLLASVRPFRTRFRFMSALVGLVPIVIYLMLAWRGSNELIVGQIDPIDRIKFIAPWVLAIVAAGTAFAVVLIVARIVDYRPGAITPLLAIMFGLPVALFEFNVGRDELYYRLLEARSSAHFTDIDASRALHEATQRAWERHPLPRPTWEAIREVAEEQWLFELDDDLGPYQTAMTRHQLALAEACDEFILYYPQSRYAVNALYLKGRALSMRIDARAFRSTKWIRFYDDFPSVASRDAWRMILSNRPNALPAAVAGLRMAQLNAREGSVERAADQLATVIARFESRATETETQEGPSRVMGVLSRGAPEDGLRVPMAHVLLEAHRLYDLFVENDDPLYGYEPISGPRNRRDGLTFGLMDLDPRHERYTDNLETLALRYPHCQIEDNIALELAKHTTDPDERIRRLEDALRRFPDDDAAPEALFRLVLAYRAANRAADGEDALARLAQRFPESIWTRHVVQQSPFATGVRLTRAGDGRR